MIQHLIVHPLPFEGLSSVGNKSMNGSDVIGFRSILIFKIQ